MALLHVVLGRPPSLLKSRTSRYNACYISANVYTVVDQIPQLDESVIRAGDALVLRRVNGKLAGTPPSRL